MPRRGLIAGSKPFVEPSFELIEAPREILVRAQEFAQLHEGARDVHAHGDGARGVQHVGDLIRTVLGAWVIAVWGSQNRGRKRVMPVYLLW